MHLQGGTNQRLNFRPSLQNTYTFCKHFPPISNWCYFALKVHCSINTFWHLKTFWQLTVAQGRWHIYFFEIQPQNFANTLELWVIGGLAKLNCCINARARAFCAWVFGDCFDSCRTHVAASFPPPDFCVVSCVVDQVCVWRIGWVTRWSIVGAIFEYGVFSVFFCFGWMK